MDMPLKKEFCMEISTPKLSGNLQEKQDQADF